MRSVGAAFRPMVAAPRQTREDPDLALDQMGPYNDPRRRQKDLQLPTSKMPAALGLPDPLGPLSPQIAQTLARSGYEGVEETMQRRSKKHKESLEMKSRNLATMKLKLKTDDIRSAFDEIDIDKSEFITAPDLKHVLAQSGIAATDKEVDVMMKMACGAGRKDKVSWEEFKLLFTRPFDLFQRVDLSQLEDIREVMKTKDVEEYRDPDFEEPIEISGVEAVIIPNGVRNLIMAEFAREGEDFLRPTDLKKMYKRFMELDEDGSGEIDYLEFCSGMKSSKDSHVAQRIFSMFDIDGSNSISLREFIVGLSSFIKASLQERQKFAFQLYDEDASGTIDSTELKNLVSANFAATEQTDESEINKKITLLYRSIGQEKTRLPMDMQTWLDVVKQNPTLVAPVLGESKLIYSNNASLAMGITHI
eukprot:GEMP01042199.1.p1 GENE.GEMP01042199.1~~GEMP01042199.1.p1  ORF type:complete len:419 (+),score=92.37 GEMP01042199.1:66-1322(+)